MPKTLGEKTVCNHLGGIQAIIHNHYSHAWRTSNFSDWEDLQKGNTNVKDVVFESRSERLKIYYCNGTSTDYIPLRYFFDSVRRLGRVRDYIYECNCENMEDLKRRIRELESNSSNQLVLRRNTETERNDLQMTKRNLETRVSDLQSSNWGLERENSRLERLVNDGVRELTTKNNQIAEKDRQIREKDNQITTYSTQLTTSQNQLRDKEGQLTLSGEEVKRVTDLFNNLQIESNNKDSQIRQKVDELRQKEREIIELKAQLGTLSPEEILNKKISLKRRELDGFINSLSFNYETVINLCDAHERLDLARRNYNQDNITNAKNEIRQFERELYTFATQNNIAVDDLHKKIYQNCEELAKLRAELERLHEQQYHAHQEQPTNR